MRVLVAEVISIMERLEEINNTPLSDIEWIYDGKVLPISEDVIEEWKFMGLSNKDFVNFRIMELLEEAK